MDFSKTRVHQRTRSCYDKLYQEFNEKKGNGRSRNGDNGGNGASNCESSGDRGKTRVCSKGKRGKIDGKEELGKPSKRRKSVKRESVIDESENEDDDNNSDFEIKEAGESEKVEKISKSSQPIKKKKNVSQSSLINVSDDDCDDDDGVELSKKSGKKKSKLNVKLGKTTKSRKSTKTNDSHKKSDDSDALSQLGCKSVKIENDLQTGSVKSHGFLLHDSDDSDGLIYLGDDEACLDDIDPSHSSRVESNEVKVDSIQGDGNDDELQGLKSSDLEDVEPQKPEEPVENLAAVDDFNDFTVISLTSSSDGEDLVNDGDDVADKKFKDIDDSFWAEVSVKCASDEDDFAGIETLKKNLFEAGVSKKGFGSSNDRLKRRRTNDDTFVQTVGKKYNQLGNMNKNDVLKILTDTLREDRDADEVFKSYITPTEEKPVNNSSINVEQIQQYKFKFEDSDNMENSENEIEVEMGELFDEMNMCQQISEIGCSATNLVNGGNADLMKEATCCRLGKHKLTINDEFGIICRYCSYVEKEIRDILPPLIKNGRGGNGRHDHDHEKTDTTKLPDFHLSNSRHDSCHDSNKFKKGTVWDLVPGVKDSMYPHQQDGFEFIWEKTAGGIYIDKLEKRLPTGGSGCIISHAPGTGKSRLTIVFLQAFLKMYPDSRPLIIAPRSMLLTWEEEFKKWNVDFPFYNMNNTECTGHEDTDTATYLKQSRIAKSVHGLRLLKLCSWKKNASVLGITYRLFETLAGEEGKRKRGANDDDEQIKKVLLQVPTLVVLDEGHTPRNDQSLMWKALLNVKTKRSIILSGTPFQNNFDELYNTLCLVNPLLSLGIINGRVGKHNSARGRWDSITSSIGKSQHRSQHNLDELKKMIDPFVHVHKGTILQEKLKGLKDALVVLKPTRTQQTLFGNISGTKKTLENDHVMSLVSVHPSLLPESHIQSSRGFQKMLKYYENDPKAGVKTYFLMELIKLSRTLNEKVLVFSQYIKPLEFISDLLKSNYKWIEGKDFLYMDGQQEEKHRQSSINALNDPKSDAKLLLASLKACSEGINLVGASRVVLLDVHWNPSVERQAISRAYRLGQTRPVFVYHLVTGTMEGEKYIRQVEKSHLSELVFSSENKTPIISSSDKILEEMVQHDRLQHMFEKVIYHPTQADLIDTFG